MWDTERKDVSQRHREKKRIGDEKKEGREEETACLLQYVESAPHVLVSSSHGSRSLF